MMKTAYTQVAVLDRGILPRDMANRRRSTRGSSRVARGQELEMSVRVERELAQVMMWVPQISESALNPAIPELNRSAVPGRPNSPRVELGS